jgi:erythromycin esterase-like protein
MASDPAVEIARRAALWFEPGRNGLDPPLETIGDARVVLIGEASHGTHEFYRIRADLAEALIEQKGFNLVAVEADWPDAYRVNRWVRGASADSDATAGLGDFTRFPRWMWRNDVVVEFATWLHDYNSSRPSAERVGFYGLDLMIHVDDTRALHPLERWSRIESDVPETYPTGM